MDQLDAIAPLINREGENDESCLDQPGPSANQIVGFAFESRADGGGEGGLAVSSSSSPSGSLIERGDQYKIVDRIINASIVLAAGSFAVTKMLTVDSDYWHVGHLNIFVSHDLALLAFIRELLASELVISLIIIYFILLKKL